MSILPSNNKNIFLGNKQLKAAANNEVSVELHIPGLIDASDITAKIQADENCGKYVLITGKAYDEQHEVGLTCKASTFRVGAIEERVNVPFNAIDAVPKAILRIAKDSCGNISEGILSLTWQTTETDVPIEVKEC